MNFFEHQDKARQSTTLLILLFSAAVICLIGITTLFLGFVMLLAQAESATSTVQFADVFDTSLLVKVAIVIVCVVLLGTLFKKIQLGAGGRVVAESLGGKLLSRQSPDHNERILLNVVEEMAIASGTPVPPVYLLEEAGINAFAAGQNIQTAVIGVTRGAIEQLSRAELQGVIAHEFSHIFNGDMRINLRLIAILNGILIIGSIGHILLRSSSRSGFRMRSSRNNSNVPFLAVGVGLMIIGYTGTFFGNWIKAAVSRQREFLADASAVQYTRDPSSIAGALKRIGGYADGSRVAHPNTAEVSHMFFGQALKPLFGRLMATHPPLPERIKRIDPRWRGSFKTQPAANKMQHTTENVSAFSSSNTVADALIASVGTVPEQDLLQARDALQAFPDELRAMSQEPYGARAIIYCLLLHDDASIRRSQLDDLALNEKAVIVGLVTNLYQTFSVLRQDSQRLLLLETSAPALAELSDKQRCRFLENLNAIILKDEYIALYEWSLYKIVCHYCGRDSSIDRATQLRSLDSLKPATHACSILLSGIAMSGGDDLAQAEDVFFKARQWLGLRLQFEPQQCLHAVNLDRAVMVLSRLKPLLKPRLLKAMLICIEADGVLKATELEMLRAISLTLDCPIPLPLASMST